MLMGRPKLSKEQKKTQMTLFMFPRTIEKLKRLAEKNGMTLSAYARFILERKVQEESDEGN
jgi:predicted DNA-binding protein